MASGLTGPERARADLEEILTEQDRVEIGEALALMAERGHPAGRVDRARRALEVQTVREGPVGSRQRFHWQMPDTCPTCMRPYRPVEDSASAPWGGNRATVGDYWQERRPPIEPVSPELAPQPMPPPPPRYEPAGPALCSMCGKASAGERGERCFFQTPQGVRCVGVLE